MDEQMSPYGPVMRALCRNQGCSSMERHCLVII